MQYDVVVIGAGPAGAVVSAMLAQKGHRVKVYEKQVFPRFSIGESLLPQSMHFLEQAGMLDVVVQAGFQKKEGAAFSRAESYSDFDFREKFSEGWGTTFQVRRAEFDKLLADQAERNGVDIMYGATITDVTFNSGKPCLSIIDAEGRASTETAQFVLDASGFGRVLPRLLDLETPSDFPVRSSLFTHIEDRAIGESFDRNKILICVHPERSDIWYWLIPFSDGRSSIGVVGPADVFPIGEEGERGEMLKRWISEEPMLARVLAGASFDTPVQQIRGFAANVKQLHGEGFALLGNAGEFLDPVFSSGVTIALKSAVLAADCLDRQLRGNVIDWDEEFALPLQVGVNTFKTFVTAWYDGRFQDIVFSAKQQPNVTGMISSILAGYAWDTTNPYVKETERRMDTLARLCRA